MKSIVKRVLVAFVEQAVVSGTYFFMHKQYPERITAQQVLTFIVAICLAILAANILDYVLEGVNKDEPSRIKLLIGRFFCAWMCFGTAFVVMSRTMPASFRTILLVSTLVSVCHILYSRVTAFLISSNRNNAHETVEYETDITLEGKN